MFRLKKCVKKLPIEFNTLRRMFNIGFERDFLVIGGPPFRRMKYLSAGFFAGQHPPENDGQNPAAIAFCPVGE
jgi:hypothetical protein